MRASEWRTGPAWLWRAVDRDQNVPARADPSGPSRALSGPKMYFPWRLTSLQLSRYLKCSCGPRTARRLGFESREAGVAHALWLRYLMIFSKHQRQQAQTVMATARAGNHRVGRLSTLRAIQKCHTNPMCCGMLNRPREGPDPSARGSASAPPRSSAGRTSARCAGTEPPR